MFKKLFLAASMTAVAHAAVVRLDIKERSDILDGKTFGNSGRLMSASSAKLISW